MGSPSDEQVEPRSVESLSSTISFVPDTLAERRRDVNEVHVWADWRPNGFFRCKADLVYQEFVPVTAEELLRINRRGPSQNDLFLRTGGGGVPRTIFVAKAPMPEVAVRLRISPVVPPPTRVGVGEGADIERAAIPEGGVTEPTA